MLINANLLAFYHECRSLIVYATHYLFCDIAVSRLQEDLDKLLNDYYIYTKTIRLFVLDFYAWVKSRAHNLIVDRIYF